MSDQAIAVANRADAPADERYDATAELTKAHAPRSLGDLLIPPEDLRPVIDHIQRDLDEQEFAKSLQRAQVIPFPSRAVRERARGMQSVWLDDLQVQINGDWYERPSAFGFDAMRAMITQTPVLNAVVMTRQRQVQRFCRPQRNGRGPGFKVGPRDKDENIDDGERRSILMLQDFFSNCGWEKNPRARARLKRDSFATFMAKLTRETLTLDSMPIETEFKRDRSQGLDGMYAVDGSTIRLCAEVGYRGDDEIFALQVVQGNIRAAYTHDDLIYVPRNPVADVQAGGYGLSETELLIRVVTGFLNAFTYNTKYFDSNSIPKGLLHLYGNFNDADIYAFKRQWNAMVKGINNSWALPVMVSKDSESAAKFENFGVEVNEMLFGRWISFLVSMICAVYGMAPDEINFESFTVGTSSLSGNDTEEKVVNSKDKGFYPLMSHFENLFTDYVVSEYGDKYRFEWTGLEDEDQKQVFERQKLTMTWDEMRAKDDLPSIGGTLGTAPLNQSLMGAWQAENQQPPEDYGQPGAEPPGAPGDDERDGSDFGAGEGDQGGGDFGAEGVDMDAEKPDDADQVAKAFGLPVLRIEP